MQVVTKLDEKFVLGKTIFQRFYPSMELRRAKYQNGGKSCLVKIWTIQNEEGGIFGQKMLFEREIGVLRGLPIEPSVHFLKLIECEAKALLSISEPRLVAYSVFEDVKYDNICQYHQVRGSRKLPGGVATHLFTEIVESVRKLQNLGLTLSNLDAQFILIDQNLNPVFTELSHLNKHNCRQLVDSYQDMQVGMLYRAPETNLKAEGTTFHTAKADSFQLGIIALFLLCNASGYSHLEQLPYKFLVQGATDQYFQQLKLTGKPECLRQMISCLIHPNPQARMDVSAIIKTQWWQLSHPKADKAALDNYVKDLAVQIEEQEKAAKKRSPIYEGQNKTRHPLFGTRRGANDSERNMDLRPKVYDKNKCMRSHYWGAPLLEAFVHVAHGAEQHFDTVHHSSEFYSLTCTKWEHNCELRMQISAYKHPTEPFLTVVSYSLLNNDWSYFSEMSEAAIQATESQKQHL